MDRATRYTADRRWPVDNSTFCYAVAVHQVHASGVGSGTELAVPSARAERVLEAEEFAILTVWAEGVSEAAAYAPERFDGLLTEARAGASWRAELGLPELSPRLADAIESLSMVQAVAPPPGTPLFDALLTAAAEDRPDGVSGEELTSRGLVQAQKFGATLSTPSAVDGLEPVDDTIRLHLADDTHVHARAVVIATGARYRRLPLARWHDFEGAGIFFAATEIEAEYCHGKPVVVIGGANSAGQASLFLASRGSPVNLVIRHDKLEAGMSDYLARRIRQHPRIDTHLGIDVTALHGRDHLTGVDLTHRSDAAVQGRRCVGLFCFIGATPATDWLDGVALGRRGRRGIKRNSVRSSRNHRPNRGRHRRPTDATRGRSADAASHRTPRARSDRNIAAGDSRVDPSRLPEGGFPRGLGWRDGTMPDSEIRDRSREHGAVHIARARRHRAAGIV